MTKYIHKNKEFFDALCNVFPSFSKRFQEACSIQIDNKLKYVTVERERVSEDNFYWAIDIPKSNIEVVKELKKNIWYSADKFDGNPNGYIFLQRIKWAHNFYYSGDNYHNSLHSDCTHFMYLDPP